MSSDAPPGGVRAANRIARAAAFRSTALRIIVEEGFDALTMQRLAADTGAAIGAVYRYFPSKGALVAECQRGSIELIDASAARCLERAAEAWQDSPPTAVAAARLVLWSRFMLETNEVHPEELKLLQMLLGEWPGVVPIEEALKLVPVTMAFLARVGTDLEAAAEAGLLEPGISAQRVICWITAVSGLLQVGRLSTFDESLLNGPALAALVSRDLLRGWGLSSEAFAVGSELVDALVASGPLATREVDPSAAS